MDTALASLIQSAAGTGAPTNTSSRYYGGAINQYTQPDGTPVVYLARRILPQPSIYLSVQNYIVVENDRIDNLGRAFLGQRFWMMRDEHRDRNPERGQRQEKSAPASASRLPGRGRQERTRVRSIFTPAARRPVEQSVPKPLIDALTSVEVTESATGRSGFQLTFTLADNSILQTLFLLSSGASIPVLRVILVATFGCLPQVIMDGIILHHEIVPDAMTGSAKLVVTGEDLSSLMDLIDFSGLPYPGMSSDIRVLTILAKYGAFGIVPEVIPVLVPDIPVPVEQTPSQKQTDLAYIQQLAKEVGYVFYLSPGPLPGMTRSTGGRKCGLAFRNRRST